MIQATTHLLQALHDLLIRLPRHVRGVQSFTPPPSLHPAHRGYEKITLARRSHAGRYCLRCRAPYRPWP
jgi:hypothetical protein